MQQQWRFFKMALMYFTVIPIATIADFQDAEQARAMKFFPLIGILVGCVAGIIYSLAYRLFPADIAVLCSLASSIYLTGCLHEDGLSDTVDGLGGGGSTERILDIMRDSRIGSFGATGLMLVLYGKLLALNHIVHELIPLTLIAAHSLSRLAGIALITALPYLRQQGKAHALAKPLTHTELLFAASSGVAPLFFLPALAGLSGLLALILSSLIFGRLLIKRIGGYTGDCLGAMQQLAELAFYLGVIAWLHATVT